MKKLVALLLAIVTLGAFCISCGGANYKNDVPVTALMEKATNTASLSSGYASGDSAYRDFKFKGISDITDQYSISYSKDGRNINFIGIFRAKSASDAGAAADICKTFLKNQKKAFEDALANYNPGEADKFDSAEVRTFGSYVVVVILTKSDAGKVFSSIESSLKIDK